MIDTPSPLAGPAPTTGQPAHASALFLRESEIRRGIELLIFGYASMIREADALLARHGLGRAHQRALYFIARQPGLAVSDLLRLLGVTKQSLSRVLADLVRLGLAEQSVGIHDRRQRCMRLTSSGKALESELFEALRHNVASAYAAAGQHAVSGFWAVLTGMIPLQQRAMIDDLNRQGRHSAPSA